MFDEKINLIIRIGLCGYLAFLGIQVIAGGGENILLPVFGLIFLAAGGGYGFYCVRKLLRSGLVDISQEQEETAPEGSESSEDEQHPGQEADAEAQMAEPETGTEEQEIRTE